jgi:hypothetical protein
LGDSWIVKLWDWTMALLSIVAHVVAIEPNVKARVKESFCTSYRIVNKILRMQNCGLKMGLLFRLCCLCVTKTLTKKPLRIGGAFYKK